MAALKGCTTSYDLTSCPWLLRTAAPAHPTMPSTSAAAESISGSRHRVERIDAVDGPGRCGLRPRGSPSAPRRRRQLSARRRRPSRSRSRSAAIASAASAPTIATIIDDRDVRLPTHRRPNQIRRHRAEPRADQGHADEVGGDQQQRAAAGRRRSRRRSIHIVCSVPTDGRRQQRAENESVNPEHDHGRCDSRQSTRADRRSAE